MVIKNLVLRLWQKVQLIQVSDTIVKKTFPPSPAEPVWQDERRRRRLEHHIHQGEPPQQSPGGPHSSDPAQSGGVWSRDAYPVPPPGRRGRSWTLLLLLLPYFKRGRRGRRLVPFLFQMVREFPVLIFPISHGIVRGRGAREGKRGARFCLFSLLLLLFFLFPFRPRLGISLPSSSFRRGRRGRDGRRRRRRRRTFSFFPSFLLFLPGRKRRKRERDSRRRQRLGDIGKRGRGRIVDRT